MMAPKPSKSQVGADLCCGLVNCHICYRQLSMSKCLVVFYKGLLKILLDMVLAKTSLQFVLIILTLGLSSFAVHIKHFNVLFIYSAFQMSFEFPIAHLYKTVPN
jgi:hypothetical protein